MSQESSCHTIAFQIWVASWPSLESSKKRGGKLVFCFIFIKETQPVAEQVPWSVSKCQSTGRGKTLFLKAFQVEPGQRLGWLFSHQNRIALVGLDELFKPRDSHVPEEARKWGGNGWTHSLNIQLEQSSVWQPHGILGQQLSKLDILRHWMFIITGSVFLLYLERRFSLGKRNGLAEQIVEHGYHFLIRLSIKRDQIQGRGCWSAPV